MILFARTGKFNFDKCQYALNFIFAFSICAKMYCSGKNDRLIFPAIRGYHAPPFPPPLVQTLEL